MVVAGVCVFDGCAGGDADGVDVEIWRGKWRISRGIILVWRGIADYGGGSAGVDALYLCQYVFE